MHLLYTYRFNNCDKKCLSFISDKPLEISGAPQTTGGSQDKENMHERRVYQAVYQGQRLQQNVKEKRLVIPSTTRAAFAAKLTTKNVRKPRAENIKTKQQKERKEHIPQTTKRDKVLGSISSLRTIDFLENDSELDNFDAFDKARIKYNIEIDSSIEEDET